MGRWVAVMVVASGGLVACGGDDDDAAPASTAPVITGVAATSAPATTEPPTTTEPAVPADVQDAYRDAGLLPLSEEDYQTFTDVCEGLASGDVAYVDELSARPPGEQRHILTNLEPLCPEAVADFEASPSTTTTTAAAPTTTSPPMDAPTVAWWNSLSGTLPDLYCDLGVDAVRSMSFGTLIDAATFDRLCAGEPPNVAIGPPYTVEELNATLGPPAAEWVAAPSGPTYDALAAAAASMVATGRSLAADALVDGGAFSAVVVVPELAVYPGNDNAVLDRLDRLALDIQLPFILRPGSYLVNAEVPPGTYRAQNVEDCYWETLDAAGEINDNSFVTAAPQVLMTVQPSDYAVNNDCAPMVHVD